MTLLRLAAACLIALTSAESQGSDRSQAFEVASVRPSSPESASGRGVFTFPGGRISASQCTLLKLIQEAFHIQSFQVEGGPRWIRTERYDVAAKAAASSPTTNPRGPKTALTDEQRRMLQSLLADRFQLKYRIETRQGPVYLLTRGNKDLQLHSPKNKDAYPWAGGLGGGGIIGDGLAGENESMQDLAERLAPYLGRPVLDKTGMSGSFDFRYAYPPSEARQDLISIILASARALGLKLEASRGPVQTVVIESVEKPAEN